MRLAAIYRLDEWDWMQERSSVRSARLMSSPAVKPPREPLAATTRWQGMTNGSGLARRAPPTGRAYEGLPETRSASWAYVMRAPYGMAEVWDQTAFWKGVAAVGIVKGISENVTGLPLMYAFSVVMKYSRNG